MNNNFLRIINEAFSKDTVEYSDKYCWNSCKSCVPSDERPVFVAHSDSYKTPGKIAHYNPTDGWYRIVEGRNKIKIRQPRRWLEALIPETYQAFVETLSNNVITEVDTALSTNWFENVFADERFWKLAKIDRKTCKFEDVGENEMHHKIVATFATEKDADSFAKTLEALAADARAADEETDGEGPEDEDSYIGYGTIQYLANVDVDGKTATVNLNND